MANLDHLIWSCTRAYNEKCSFYLGDGKPHPMELNTEEAKQLLQKVKDYGVDNFFITGAGITGEPLIRKDFLELINHCNELGLSPYVKITGEIFSSEIAEKFKDTVAMVIITLAGPKDIDIKLRGDGIYEKSIKAAKICAKKDIPFAISFVNTKYLVNRIKEIVYLSKELGARSFHFASLIPQPICRSEQRDVLGPLEPSPLERDQELNQIYDLSKELGDKISLVPYDMFYNRILKTKEPTLNLKTTCSACNNLESNDWLEILDDGTIYACGPLNLSLGNIKKDNLTEIWTNLRKSKFLNMLADRNNLKGKCGLCEYKSICGGCRARALFITGSAFNSDPACPYIPKELKN
ncbi:MAG: SPASM domain-containing protein [Candidatus Bathyarchaeota archaeon]